MRGRDEEMSSKRLFQAVAEQITALIDEGAYPPGTRLPGERELATKLGVSRVTIREAEIALQALGRLEVKTGSGVYVSDRKPAGTGALLSSVAGWALAFYFFKTSAAVSIGAILSVPALVTALTVIAGVLGCWGIFQRSALETLRAEA